MADFLYSFTGDGVYVLQVTGIDKNKLKERQRFSVVNGAWDGFYQDGIVTYPVGDWRHKTSRNMEVYLGFTFEGQLEKFEYRYYNYVIYRFEKDILGLYKEAK